MNYTKYLQTGGELGMPTSKYNLTNKDVDSLIGKILNGDKEAAAIFVDSAVNDPENAWVREAINGAMMAAEQGDQSAQQFLGVITPMLAEKGINLKQSPQLEKAGGNIPSGKAKQNGKYGCPCMLKKVGGKIIEVNSCDDSIAKAKNGMKLPKFKEPAGKLTFWQRYAQTKPMSIQEFARTYLSDQAIGNAIKKGWNAADKYLNENVFAGSFWQNGPSKPVQQVTPNERASMNGAGNQPLTQEEADQVIAQRREGSTKIQPTAIEIKIPLNNESAVAPEPQTETKKEAPAVDNQLALKNWYNRYTTEQQRNIQLALQRAGYDIGKYGADGKIGNDTIKAIRKFQQDNKLLVDGKVGRDTLGKLWDIAYKGKSYATGAITPSAVNLDAPRQDIYNPATATAPYAQVNPIVAANKQGGIISYAQYLRK